MKCSAFVRNTSLAIRSRHSSTDQQCQRNAKVDGMCYQHARMKWCQARGCERQAIRQEGKWWLCARHGPLYAEHNRVVDRILAIPPRA
jgi:hypothetical protein